MEIGKLAYGEVWQNIQEAYCSMITPETCPKCGVSLEGEKIHEAEQALPKYSMKHWSRAIIVVEGSKAIGFQCPDCKGEWKMPWQDVKGAVDMDLG